MFGKYFEHLLIPIMENIMSSYGQARDKEYLNKLFLPSTPPQGFIFRLTCSYPELTEDHVLTSAYVKISRTVTRNAVNKSV